MLKKHARSKKGSVVRKKHARSKKSYVSVVLKKRVHGRNSFICKSIREHLLKNGYEEVSDLGRYVSFVKPGIARPSLQTYTSIIVEAAASNVYVHLDFCEMFNGTYRCEWIAEKFFTSFKMFKTWFDVPCWMVKHSP